MQAVSRACDSQALIEEASNKIVALYTEVDEAFAIIESATSTVIPVVLTLEKIGEYDMEFVKDEADRNFDGIKLWKTTMIESSEHDRNEWFRERKQNRFKTIVRIFDNLQIELSVKCLSRAKEQTENYLQNQIAEMERLTKEFIGRLMIKQLSICPGCMTPPYLPVPTSLVGKYISATVSSNAFTQLR